MRTKIIYLLAARTWGGGEQYIYDLVRHLPAERYESFLVVPAENTYSQRLLEIVDRRHLIEMGLHGITDLNSAMRLRRLIACEGIDLIHANNFKDALTARIALYGNRRTALLVTRHLVRPGKTGMVYRRLYRRIDRIVFVSRTALNGFLAARLSVDKAKLDVIHNAVVDYPDCFATVSETDGPVHIVYAGRIAAEKGLDTLLDAIRRLHETGRGFKLSLAGTGEMAYVEALQHRIDSAGLDGIVTLCGFTDRVDHFLRRGEIGVLPSTVPESFGLALVEYMRAGLPVVSTDNGAQPELIDHGIEGLLVPPGDARTLADALKNLIDDRSLRRKMGQLARRRYERDFAYDRFLQKMTDLYDELTTARRQGSER